MDPGDIISYLEMCQAENVSLQRGMNYRLAGGYSVVLMSVRPGAPYADKLEDEGRILIYEGHDVPQKVGGPDPKSVDQPGRTPSGQITQNGLFFQAAEEYKAGRRAPELVKVYEKVRQGIWVFNGVFALIDAWRERVNNRFVFKYRLEMIPWIDMESSPCQVAALEHARVIPSSIKQQVWKRDGGRCTKCGSTDNLHFDHIIPYSKGGSSLTADNIQLLCARHNLSKHDAIE